MDTTVPAAASQHAIVRVTSTRPTEFIDLTDRLETLVAGAGIRQGFVSIQTRHTTTAVVVNEHEPLLLADMADLLQRLVAEEAGYRHDDALARTANVIAGERRNGHGHCRALLLGSAALLNVADGRLQLGRWQRVFLVELDGPQAREVSVLVMGEAAR